MAAPGQLVSAGQLTRVLIVAASAEHPIVKG